MKLLKHLPLAIAAIICSNSGKAQISTASENLDINQLNIKHLVHGDMWYDAGTGNPACEFPKGSGKHASNATNIWLTGRDAAGDLHVSAQIYRALAADYYPGPLDATGSTSTSSITNWGKIWKINAQTVQEFIKDYATSGAAGITAAKYDVIKEWPATGNVFAKGAAGASLPELVATGLAKDDFAPFVDVNGDNIYNWQDGDYPIVKGDQMLWWVFNDNGPMHNGSKGLPLKVEFHASAYAYNRGTDVDRMVFYEFLMHNKSTNKYDDFRFGMFSDEDLGSPMDDYLAFDSSHRMGIVYNAAIPDLPNGTNSYGNHPPITGLSFVELPGDVYPSAMLPAGSFNYFNSPSGEFRKPIIDTEYNHIMMAKGATGNPRYFGNYAYPITKGAIMCDSSYVKNDQRYVISSNSFMPATKVKIAMAFMVTDTTGNACPTIDFKPLTDLADTAWKVYWNPLPLSTKEFTAQNKNNLKLYPNPSKNVVYIQTNNIRNEELKIIDALGRTIEQPVEKVANGQYQIQIANWATGVYSVLYFDGTSNQTLHFIKE